MYIVVSSTDNSHIRHDHLRKLMQHLDHVLFVSHSYNIRQISIYFQWVLHWNELNDMSLCIMF